MTTHDVLLFLVHRDAPTIIIEVLESHVLALGEDVVTLKYGSRFPCLSNSNPMATVSPNSRKKFSISLFVVCFFNPSNLNVFVTGPSSAVDC